MKRKLWWLWDPRPRSSFRPLADRELTRAERDVLGVFGSRWLAGEDAIRMGKPVLAAETGLSLRAIQDALASLLAAGLIVRDSDKGGRGRVPTYRLIPPLDCERKYGAGKGAEKGATKGAVNRGKREHYLPTLERALSKRELLNSKYARARSGRTRAEGDPDPDCEPMEDVDRSRYGEHDRDDDAEWVLDPSEYEVTG